MLRTLEREDVLPIVVKPDLTDYHRQRFECQFVEPNRDELEVLWRRTQQPETISFSQMETEKDRRRRMIHGLDSYKMVERGEGFALAITAPYIWFEVASPFRETREYVGALQESLSNGGWATVEAFSDMGSYEKGSLGISYVVKEREVHDETSGRVFPRGYNFLEVEICGGKEITQAQRDNPWNVLNSGIRKRDVRGNPQEVVDLRTLERFFPMQVELGCGPSIEAGIPPLHYLHRIYQVQEPITGQFIFGPNKDNFLRRAVEDPTAFYLDASALYSAALTAEPTPFYQLLGRLRDQRIIAGDVITNNFDGLCSCVNLSERYVRRFDEPSITPNIEISPEANSLLVVGSHADRRQVQRQSRERGLPIIYVDPEGYFDENGRFIKYPLESARDGDILVPMTAQEFTDAWERAFE